MCPFVGDAQVWRKEGAAMIHEAEYSIGYTCKILFWQTDIRIPVLAF